MNIKKFLTKEEQLSVLQAIADAEKETSGEIRIHVTDKCKGDILDSAAHFFRRLKMHKAELRNCVLVYLAISDRKFAVIGDAGIHSKVPEGCWDNIKGQMAVHFSKKDFVTGLKEGILLIGHQLKEYFPYDKKNEHSKDISFS